MSAAFAEIGITPRAFCLLFHAREAERTQIELAELADLDKTTMVATVDELEAAGLARRRPSSTDRRARIIEVTKTGQRAVAQGTKIADRVHREAFEALPVKHGTVLADALSRLVEGHLSTPAQCDPPVRRPRRKVAVRRAK
jgi:DNA-binding MarR family transcriptional regulator